MTVGDPLEDERQRPARRERVVRTLTFWLRPEFVLRVVNRFQKVAGFDRAIALASGALTATIPLAIVTSAVATQLGGKGTAERIIDRYELTGGGAEAVKDIFAPPTGASTTIGIVGFLFLLIAVLSFTRAMQRLFEQTWELSPLSVRNTVNGLLWIGVLAAFLTLSGFIHGAMGRSRLELGAALISAPLSAVFLVWSGRVLSGKRIALGDLIPFGVLGSVLLAVYSIGADGVRPAPVQHLRHPVRRDRRGLRDDLRALLRDGRDRRVRGGRARGPRRARTDPAWRAPRRGRGPPPMGPGHRRGPFEVGDPPATAQAGVTSGRRGRRSPTLPASMSVNTG